MIIPTIGRQVWYWPFIGQMEYSPLENQHEQPFAATVVHVIDDSTVNLLALTETGNPLRLMHVRLAQDRPALAGEASWMPYQIESAAKSKNEKFRDIARSVPGLPIYKD